MPFFRNRPRSQPYSATGFCTLSMEEMDSEQTFSMPMLTWLQPDSLGQVQQVLVPGGVDGPQAAPVEVQGHQGLEQFLGVLPVAGEIVVDEIDVFEAGDAHVGLDFGDHLVNGPPAIGVAVDDGDLAEGAVIGAAPDGLGGEDLDPVAPVIQQLQAGPGQPDQIVKLRRLIAALAGV